MKYLFCDKGISSIGHVHPTHTSNLLVECCIFHLDLKRAAATPVPFPGSVKICQGFPSALTTDNCGVVHTRMSTPAWPMDYVCLSLGILPNMVGRNKAFDLKAPTSF